MLSSDNDGSVDERGNVIEEAGVIDVHEGARVIDMRHGFGKRR